MTRRERIVAAVVRLSLSAMYPATVRCEASRILALMEEANRVVDSEQRLKADGEILAAVGRLLQQARSR